MTWEYRDVRSGADSATKHPYLKSLSPDYQGLVISLIWFWCSHKRTGVNDNLPLQIELKSYYLNMERWRVPAALVRILLK